MQPISQRTHFSGFFAALAFGVGGALGLLVLAVLDAFLWKPAGIPTQPGRVGFVLGRAGGESPRPQLPPGSFLFLRDRFTAAAAIAASGRELVNFGTGPQIEKLPAEWVTADFFSIYGLRATAGRTFSRAEQEAQEAVAVLSTPLARRLFGEPQAALDQRLRFNGREFVVIGVLPPLPESASSPALWLPVAFTARDQTDFTYPHYRVQFQLRPGASFADAARELDHLSGELQRLAPNQVSEWRASIRSWRDDFAAPVRPFQPWLIAAGFLSVALAAINGAGLLLSHAASRQRDFAIRCALGAPRLALVWPLVRRSALVATGGALLAWILFAAMIHGVKLQEPSAPLVRLVDPLSFRSLATVVSLGLIFFTCCLSLLLRFALRVGWQEALKQVAVADPGVRRTQRVIAGLQVAITVALVANTGPLVELWNRLRTLDLGFSPEARAYVTIIPSPGRYDTAEKRVAFAESCVAQLAKLPGVERVGLSTALPLSRHRALPFHLQGAPTQPASEWPKAIHAAVNPDYLDAMGIKVIAGRGLSNAGSARGEKVALINRTLARRYFGERDPLNTWIYPGTASRDWRLIVGIVDDVRYEGLQEEPTPQIYEPFWQAPSDWFLLVLQGSTLETLPTPAALQAAIAQVDAEQAIGPMRNYTRTVANLSSRERLTALTFITVSAVALLLATASLTSLLALQALERAPEFALRVALGATPREIVQTFGSAVLQTVIPGLLVGLLAGHALGKIGSATLVGLVAPSAVDYLLAVTAPLLATGLAAWRPILHAIHADPAALLRGTG